MKVKRGIKKKKANGRPANGTLNRIKKFEEMYPDVVTMVQSYDSNPTSPARWRPDYERQIFWLALAGMTEAMIANIMGVKPVTFNLWKKTHPKFLEALEAGRHEAVGIAAHSLFEVGVGFECEAVKMFPSRVKEYETDPVTGRRVIAREYTEIISKKYIKRYPPNVTALKAFLAAKMPEVWSDRQEVHHTGEVTHSVDLTKLTDKQLKLLRQFKDAGIDDAQIVD